MDLIKKVDIDFVASLVVGGRPAGGPYTVTVCDGPRHLANKEYTVFVECISHPNDEADDVLFRQTVNADIWTAAIRKQYAGCGLIVFDFYPPA